MRRKPIPTFAVVKPSEGTRLASAHAKLELMQNIQAQTDGGKWWIAQLMRLATTAEKESVQLSALELLAAYGFGKPIETKVTADMSMPPPSSGDLESISSLQLEAAATAVLEPHVESETVTEAETEAAGEGSEP
jgi:hypothetical protein